MIEKYLYIMNYLIRVLITFFCKIFVFKLDDLGRGGGGGLHLSFVPVVGMYKVSHNKRNI